VKFIQFPAGHGVRESGFFPLAMAFIASIRRMAIGADGMDLFLCFDYDSRLFQIMTIITIFFLMTIDAS
jgi:hypothetical protein